MLRLIRILAGLAAIAIILGYGVYLVTIANLRPPEDPRADAIVALTGGQARLETALRLLEEERGERLLISGVSAIASRADIRAMAPPGAGRFDCCVDLDRVADSTAANARETANWAREHNYNHVLLVTQAYHMPRARRELSRAAPDVNFVPYPVGAWRDAGLRRTMVEYAKLLVILGRETALGWRGGSEA